MRKILHIITGLEPGGAEAVLLRMVSSLRDYRHVVLSLGGRGAMAAPLEQAGARVETLGLRDPAKILAAPLRLREIIRRTSPDLIQSWLVHGNVLAALAHGVLAPGTPLVWNVRQSLDALDKEKWLTRKIIASSPLLARVPAAIVYNSVHSANQHEALGYPSDLRVVIPNGFDIEEFAPHAEARRQVRSELGMGQDAFLIGLVGRYHPVKNHAGFFDAAVDVLKVEPRAHFLLVGAGTEMDRIRPLVESQLLRERIVGLGPRHDVARINCALDIACNVSHSEAFPNAVGEAMASGVPCVVTPVGESRRIVGDTGVVAEDTKGSSIAAALLQLIALGPEARGELGRRARERIVDNYSLSRAALSFEQLYEQLMGRGADSPALPARLG